MATEASRDLLTALNDMVAGLRDSGILDDGDPLLSQSFVEGETKVPEIAGAVIASMDEDEVLIEGLKKLIDDLSKRKSRIEARQDNKRGLLELTMMRAEIAKLETPAATLSLRAVPQKLADDLDEALIPSDYFEPQAPKLSRKKLLDALKAGAVIDGAKLTNGGQALAIRRH